MKTTNAKKGLIDEKKAKGDEDEEYAPESGEFDEPEESKESSEGIKSGMEEGTVAEDVYTEEGREKLADDDEIAPWEEGFAEGAEQKGLLAKCAHCGKILSEDNFIEREIDGKIKWFCSDKCAAGCKAKHRAD